MKYTVEIEINLPRDQVIALFDSEENLALWQPTLVSTKHLSGEKGQVGAKTEMVYQMGKRQCEMVETITVKNLPHEFSGTYEAKGVWNEVKNYMEEVDENTTKWRAESEFKFSNIMMKIMGWLFPNLFKKESMKFLRNFKQFAETGKPVKA
jgi:hypothetical protein